MFRKLGSKIVELYQDDLAIKKDAHNFILFGGLLAAVLATAVTKFSQILSHGRVSSTAPLSRLNTLTPHIPSHLATTRLDPKHLKLTNLQGLGGSAGPKI